MGVLDDAIREHLELKRRHGASEVDIARAEAEALGPARRDPSVAYEPPPAEPEYAPEPYGHEPPPAEPYEATTLHEPEPPTSGLFDHEAEAPDAGASGYAHAEEPAPYEPAEPPPAAYEPAEPPPAAYEDTHEQATGYGHAEPPASEYEPAPYEPESPAPGAGYEEAAHAPPSPPEHDHELEPPAPAGDYTAATDMPPHAGEPLGGYEIDEEPAAPPAGYEHGAPPTESYGAEPAGAGDPHDYESPPPDFAAPPDPTRPAAGDDLLRPDPGETHRHGDAVEPPAPHQHPVTPPGDPAGLEPEGGDVEPAAHGDPLAPDQSYREAVGDQPTEHFVPPDVDYGEPAEGEEEPRGGRIRRWFSRRSER
jgi:hypothetical protein